ncbi:riboflavin synthase [Paenibacillus sp. FSL W8-1187]|uniref:Riboflavin synthase n=1 Tax=Paenibacillus pasadenensis TaxID=217090 RepID=A0A2N5N5G3_9BACL|nr:MULTISPECIES: riboflavin synthase [Paenibacillus]PLT45596.1 Riboflavin synthase eubacterial/eukaryotic [Paenibacillus pasadenensis]QGG56049.1 riboflavin synthase [Paenibacillus sp. B01]
MFTGLIEEIGELRGAARKGEAMVLRIGAAKVLEGVRLGDSIAVNGVCLTVTGCGPDSFEADVMPETYRHTNLGGLPAGSPLNLERAMRADGRFGGHIVQGHVDGIGRIVERRAYANAVLFTIRPADEGLRRYIIPRGSIAVDGISLTVTEAGEDAFSVSIIPHTLAETVLQSKQAGATVNLECDVLGKYVDHLLRFGGRGDAAAAGRPGGAAGGPLTAAFLAENGFA